MGNLVANGSGNGDRQPRQNENFNRLTSGLAVEGFTANLQAEQSVLAAVMIDSDTLGESRAAISADHFSRESHGLLFQVMCDLMDRGDPVDVTTISTELRIRGQLQEIGGVAELARLASLNVIPSHAGHYAGMVAQAASKRNLLIAAQRIAGLATADGGSGAALWAEAAEILNNASLANLGSPFDLKSLADIWATQAPVSFLTTDIRLPGVYIFYGPPESYKTWATLDLAVAVATGSLWLGTRPVTSGPVIIVDEENGSQRLTERLRALLRGRDFQAGDDFPIHFIAGQGLNVLDGTQMQALSQAVRDRGAILVTIDALIDVAGGSDENSAEEQGAVMQSLRRLSEECECTVILIDHSPKANGSPRDLRDMIRGSSAKAGAVDGALYFVANRDTHCVSFKWGKQRDAGSPPFSAQLNFTGLRAWFSEGSVGDTKPARSAEQYVLDCLQNGPAWKTAMEAGAERCGCSKSAVKQAISSLANAGQIHRIDGGGPGKKARYALAQTCTSCAEPARLANLDYDPKPVLPVHTP